MPDLRSLASRTMRTMGCEHWGFILKKTLIVSSAVSATVAAATATVTLRNIHQLLDDKSDNLAVRRLRADVDALYAHHMIHSGRK